MEFHGKYSIEFHGTPWNSMEVFYTGEVKYSKISLMIKD